MGSAVFDRVIAKLQNFRHLRLRRTSLVIACVVLMCIVGYADYLTAYDRPVLLFYLLPLSVAAWFGSLGFSLAIAIGCVGAWLLSDVAGGTPFEGWWNLGMAFAAFVVFAGVLSKLATLVRELDRRVDQRTADLKREMAERQRLDRAIVLVADRERRRLGQDLHDRLGQHLIGTGLELAFSWLDRGLATGAIGAFYKDEPAWDPIRSDPRFTDLLRRIGIPQ